MLRKQTNNKVFKYLQMSRLMRIPKKYGQSKVDLCPFCKQQAVIRNSQGIPVCNKHKEKKLGDATCACGATLELRIGKFGAYFHCINCGNISWSKAMSVNDFSEEKSNLEKRERIPVKKDSKETIIRADELDFL